MKLLGFLLKIFWTLITRPVVILVMAVLLFLIFRYGGSIQEQVPGPIYFASKILPQSRAVDQAAGEVAASIVEACPPAEKSYTRLLIIPLRDDREQAIENQIREKFQKRVEQGEFTLVEKSTLTQLGEQIQEILPGGGSESEPITKEDAIKIGKTANAEVVLFGQVDTFVPEETSHKIEGKFQFVNVVTGDTLATSRFSNMINSEKTTETTGGISMTKLVVLLLFLLFWPFALVPLMRRVIRRESNRDNLLAILLMTAIPFGMAIAFIGNMTANIFFTIGFLLFFVIAAGWIGFVMNKVAQQ